MKAVIKLALFFLMLYILFGVASWLMKKLIFVALVGGVVYWVYHSFFASENKPEHQEPL
jgi:hypothetical protein